MGTWRFGGFPWCANNRKLNKVVYRFDVPARRWSSATLTNCPLDAGRNFWQTAIKWPIPSWAVGRFQGCIGTRGGRRLLLMMPSIPPFRPLVGGPTGWRVPTRSSLSCSELEFGNPQKNYLFNAGNAKQAASTGRPLAFAPAGEFQIGNDSPN